MKLKITYLVTAILTIFCGVLVRTRKEWFPEWVNFWLGDMLYAFMMYYLVAVLLARRSAWIKAATALIICYIIEFGQLWHGEWIDSIRATLPGRLVLGQGFLWSDLLAYLTGVALAFCVDVLWFRPKKTTT